MITELTIEGFKSFGSPGVDLRLGPLNFLVGANAAGKSNVISALSFLQNAVMKDVDFAVAELGGNSEVRNKILRQKKVTKPVRLHIKFDDQAKVENHRGTAWILRGFDYELTLNLREANDRPVIESETMTANLFDSKNPKSGALQFKLERSRDVVKFTDPTQSEKVHQFPVPNQERTRLALGVGFFAIPCVLLREIIGHWRFYNVSPRVARQPCKETLDIDLGPAGENLAVVLHRLEQSSNGKLMEGITRSLRGIVAGFKDVKTTQLPVEGKWAFQILEDKIQGAINPEAVSDGTIRLLALMVITASQDHRDCLVAIEEPENGLHPHVSEHLVEVLRTASKHRQLLVTTHNPAFLDFLKPEEVILCDKSEGLSQIRRASDIQDIGTFQKHFRLGELWLQGALGGIP